MTPYRTSGKPGKPEDPPPIDDDRVILCFALVIAILGLIPRIGSSSPWGAEPTLALIIAIGSVLALVRDGLRALRRRRRSRASRKAALRANRRTRLQ